MIIFFVFYPNMQPLCAKMRQPMHVGWKDRGLPRRNAGVRCRNAGCAEQGRGGFSPLHCRGAGLRCRAMQGTPPPRMQGARRGDAKAPAAETAAGANVALS